MITSESITVNSGAKMYPLVRVARPLDSPTNRRPNDPADVGIQLALTANRVLHSVALVEKPPGLLSHIARDAPNDIDAAYPNSA
jgi:hypothetical protein